MDPVVTINGEVRPLRLTLGALADIEEALGQGDFAKAAARLAAPGMADLLVILQALLKGGGAGVTLEALRVADIDFREAADAVARAFRALHPKTNDLAEAEQEAGKKPLSPGGRGSRAPSSP